jgi:D-alanyl-D-alanine endopeptidase (penicillin-binding protein 7)
VLAAALLRRPAYLLAGLVVAALACWLMVVAWNGDEASGGGETAVVQPTQPEQPAQPLQRVQPEAAPPAVEGDEAPPQAAPAAVPASGPYVPALTSANPNLSFARRAGLHRAANPLRLTASAALVVDPASGKALYARNENAILPIASLTKLLAAMVLLDAKLPMGERIRITKDDVDRLRYSRSRVPVGTTMSRAEALRLALMSSENRAAHALARTSPGGVAAFVQAMNDKAAQLGMRGSTFADPTGLTNRNRATATDVARLVEAAARYPRLRSYTTIRRHRAVFGKRHVPYLNANRLVRQTHWPIVVQKTGYIVESGHCMAMVTRIGQRTVTLVLLDSGSMTHGVADARRLRAWAARHAAGK